MSDAQSKPPSKTPYLFATGVLAFIAGAGWLLLDRQPVAEQRWKNHDIAPVDGAHFQTVRDYRLPAAQGGSGGGEQEGWERPNVAVYSTPNPPPRHAPLTLETLSDIGQAHAIDHVAESSITADAAWQQPSKAVAAPDEHRDPYRADRVLVATVAKGLRSVPGERLLWTRVFVQPINFKFAGYGAASSDIKTIKVATLENNQTANLSLGLDAVLPSLGKTAEPASAAASNKITADINQQYESLGVDIRPRFLRIIRESATGGDVVGNTMIQLSTLTDPRLIVRTAANEDATGKEYRATPALVIDQAQPADGVASLDEDNAEFSAHPQDILPHCPLIAETWMIYEIRKVEAGANHYLEGLQRVQLIRDGELKQTVEIVPADDIAPAVWSVKRQTAETPPDQAPDLQAKLADGTLAKVVSTDYAAVARLARWLMAKGPGQPLNGMALSHVPGETLVPFKNTRNECGK